MCATFGDAMCASGFRPTLLAHRSGRARRASAVLCFLWIVSATGLARETSASRLPFTTALWDQGGVVADLDGDGRPDTAIVKAVGWGLSAFKYRIEFVLSAGFGPSSCNVSAEEGGLRIIPRDVDGDGSLDLVLTSARLHTPVGVLINNGRGRFIPTSPTRYSRSNWSEGTGIASDAQREVFRANGPQSSRSWRVLSRGSYFCFEAVYKRRSDAPTALCLLCSTVNQPQGRAPPRFLDNPGNC